MSLFTQSMIVGGLFHKALRPTRSRLFPLTKFLGEESD